MPTLAETAQTLTPEPWVTGLIFGESPRYYESTKTLYVSDMIGQKIHTISQSGEMKVLLEVENQPNGMSFTNSGNSLIYSSMFDAKLHRYDLSTQTSELYADLGTLMTGYCGDMVIDAHDRVFIDDTGARVLHGEQPKPGRLLTVDPNSKAVSSVAEGIVFPNGIAIDSTGENLFLGESFAYHFERFKIDPNGQLSDRTTIWDARELAPLAEKEFTRFSTIDGIAIDAEDGIWLSMLGYHMFIRRDVNGNITHKIHVDGDATACELGGEDGRTLYLVINKVPAGETLFKAMVEKQTKGSICTVRVDIPRRTA